MLNDEKTVENKERLRRLKLARLKMYESQLQLQKKNGADNKTIHQTMKDISKIRRELGTSL